MPQQQTSSTTWALIAGACLVLGLAVGYVIFGGQRAAAPVVLQTTAAPSQAAGPAPALFDEQQAQTFKNVLARDPKNVQAATQLGNMLYDAGRYAEAVPYYQQAFTGDAQNVNLSTDLGTALWYSGKPDEAIAQLNKSLALNPTHPQTLFNLGVVKKDGKQDPAGAVQAWEKLLQTNPNYVDRAKVQQLLDEARQTTSTAPIAPVRSGK